LEILQQIHLQTIVEETEEEERNAKVAEQTAFTAC
jgi:hypothetical protein